MSDLKAALGYSTAILSACSASLYLDRSLFRGLGQDLVYLKTFAPLVIEMAKKSRETRRIIPNMLREACIRWPNKEALVFVDNGQSWTWKDVDIFSNRVANWLLKNGIKKGDVVGFICENRPEYVMFWMGASKIGAKAALLNTHIAGKGLEHCLNIANCKLIVVSASEFSKGIYLKKISSLSGANGTSSLSLATYTLANGNEIPIIPYLSPNNCPITGKSSDPSPIDPNIRGDLDVTDTLFLIYTSGTTGLPKAGVITHWRFFGAGFVFSRFFNINESDRVYLTLPLYHSSGGMLGVSLGLYAGATLLIRSRFSSRNFMREACQLNATVFQYIGELCRYLLTSPHPDIAKTQNSLRIAIGSGLGKDIWNDFIDHMGLSEIGEFYGSTEGNVAFLNHHYKGDRDSEGVMGHCGLLLKKIMGWRNIQHNIATETPHRDPASGFCVEVDNDGPGELIGVIKDQPGRRFAGYYGNKKATEKKILKNVFSTGDRYFRSGDLISYDSKGYIRFVDRIGDTFRWKSENVSTTEVAQVISTVKGVQECNVYGVQIPGYDGRACMVALVLEKGYEAEKVLNDMQGKVDKELPKYAIPIFVRLQTQMTVTATFKQSKVQLKKDGFDLNVVKDPIYWLEPTQGKYKPFTKKEEGEIIKGTARL